MCWCFLKMQPPRAAASTISLPLLLSFLASPPPPLQPRVLFLHPFSFLVSLADDDDYDDYYDDDDGYAAARTEARQ